MQYSSRLEKTLRYMFWLTALIPSGWFFLFYSFVLRTRFSLGKWPLPYNPDPKDLGFNFHWFFIWFSFLVVLFSPLLFIYMFLMTFRVIKMNKKRYAVACAIFIFFLATCLLLPKYDPGEFVEWFLD